jgi:hypothetical protein
MADLRKILVSMLVFLFLIDLLLLPFVAPNVECQTNFPIVQTSDPLVDYNLTMLSPKANATFTNVMLLDYSLKINSNLSRLGISLGLFVSYIIDNNSEIILIGGDQNLYEFIDVTHLKNGIHQLTFLAQFNYLYNDTIFHNKQELTSTYFSILNKPATIHILSPQNSIYFNNSIPLKFKIDNPSTYNYQHYPLYWQGYSLDGGNKELQNVNDTLTGLSDGFHTLTFYVEIGNTTQSSSTVSFLVVTTSFCLILIITAIASVAAIAIISLLIYRRHRKTANLKLIMATIPES